MSIWDLPAPTIWDTNAAASGPTPNPAATPAKPLPFKFANAPTGDNTIPVNISTETAQSTPSAPDSVTHLSPIHLEDYIPALKPTPTVGPLDFARELVNTTANMAIGLLDNPAQTALSFAQIPLKAAARLAISGEQGLQKLGVPGSALPIPLDEKGQFTPVGPFQQFALGSEPLGNLAQYGKGAGDLLAGAGVPEPLAKNPALTGLIGVVGSVLDLSLVGGETGAVKSLVATRSEAEAASILRQIGVQNDLIPTYSKIFASIDNEQEAKAALDHLAEFQRTTNASAANLNSRQLVENDLPGMVDHYITNNTDNAAAAKTITINTDNARELFAPYQQDRSLSAAVHDASSEIKNAAYDKALETQKGVGNNTVLVTAGGTGAGKTSGLEILGQKVGDYPIVLDGNLNTFDSAVKNIEKAISAGYKVDITFTYGDIEKSLDNALGRSTRQEAQFGTGRTVPLAMHIDTHTGSIETLPKLIDKYGSNEDVTFRVFDVSGPKGVKVSDPIAFAQEKAYNGSYEELYSKLQKRVLAAAKEGIISERTARGFLEEIRKPSESGQSGGRTGGGIQQKVQPRRGRPSFAVAAKTSPDIEAETQKLIQASPYDRVSNKSMVEAAQARVAASTEEATRFVLSNETPDAETTATGIELMKKLQAEKNYQGAAEIADTLANRLVKGGQFIQAAKVLQRLSPEGVLFQAQKIIKDVNEVLSKKRFGNKTPVTLTDEFADKLTDLAKQRDLATDPILKEEIGWEIGSMLASLKKASIGEKVSMAQTILQLLNPKTLITRNPLGNEIFYRVERLNKYIATPIDWAKSTLTGTDRTVSFRRGGQQGVYWQSFMRGARAGWKGVEPGALPSQLDIGRQVFKSKYNPFYWGEKVLGASLRGFDFAAYSRAKNETIGELSYLRAVNEGKSGAEAVTAARQYAKEADDNILQIADQYGRYITFQDDNLISVGLQKMKRGLNLGLNWGLGDLALKYPRTPGALLMRAIEYSPAGILRSAYLIAKPLLKGGAIDSREVAQATSRAIIGTVGFTALGYYLADKGIITGKSDNDTDVNAFDRMTGTGQYKINLSALKRWVMSGFSDTSTQQGDYLYSYDWAQPIAVSLSIGANASLGDDQIDTIGMAGAAVQSLEGGIDTLAQQPLVQGITTLFGFQDPVQGTVNTALSLPAAFVPTLSNQFAQWLDNTRRNAYDPNVIAQALNYAIKKVPFFEQKLSPMVDTFGKNSENYQGNSNNIFNVFFNPGFLSKYTTTPESQLVIDVMTSTGDSSVAPRVASKSVTIDGQKVQLSAKQYEAYQRSIGQMTFQAFGEMASSEAFMSLSDADKADLMGQTLTDIGKAARDALFGSNTASGVTYQDRLLYLNVQYLAKNGQTDAAQQVVNSLSDDQYDAYKAVRTAARTKNTTTLRDLLQKNPVDAVSFLRAQPADEQQRLLKLMTDDEYKLYQEGKDPNYTNTKGSKFQSDQFTASENKQLPTSVEPQPASVKDLLGLNESAPGVSKATSVSTPPLVNGQFPSFIDNLSKKTINDFPFADVAKGQLADVNYSAYDFKKDESHGGPTGVEGQFNPAGQDTYDLARKILPEAVASWLSDVARGTGIDKPNIEIQKDMQGPVEEVMAHEMLHAIFDKGPMSPNSGDQTAAEKMREDFLHAWDVTAENDPDVAPLLNGIDDHLDSTGYNLTDNASLATERFAYLGQEALTYGPSVIPIPLRKFYAGVLKPATNAAGAEK